MLDPLWTGPSSSCRTSWPVLTEWYELAGSNWTSDLHFNSVHMFEHDLKQLAEGHI